MQKIHSGGWAVRDFIAAVGLFLATAAFVLWQNSRLTVLWDLSYLLDSSYRIALGQVPYRDFPFAHAPLTFLVQAMLIRLTGRVFFHHVIYAVIVGAAGTVVCWRTLVRLLRGRVAADWAVALLLATPLTVLGIYCIFPEPYYDCDCIFWILVAVLLLQRLIPVQETPSRLRGFVAGAVAVVPLFFKQNIGLPFLLITVLGLLVLLVAKWLRPELSETPRVGVLGSVLAGVATALLLAGGLIQATAGLGNYLRWTIQFAAARRMPRLGVMLEVYQEPMLLWMLPCVVAAVLLLGFGKRRWMRGLAVLLLAVPFLWTIVFLMLNQDVEDRAANLLALWPLLLILSLALTLYGFRHGLSLRLLLPVVLLATIHGTLLSQQLWGSTYAIWPLLILLVAEMVVFLAGAGLARGAVLTLVVVVAATLLLAGGLYMASEERLSYAQVLEGALVHSRLAALKGMAVHGDQLAGFEELVAFADSEIPKGDGLVLLPGEDPFYYTTGRVPQFPVLLFDPATEPYSPAQLAEMVRSRGIRWLILKKNLQLRADPTPEREATLRLLSGEFGLYRELGNYEVYRRP